MVASRTLEFLTAFSSSLDYFAISSGDGRIKIWDAVNGQLQTEFSNISSSNRSIGLLSSKEHNRGHLSLDYTCMTWIPLDKKKKRKLESALLVLGTGSGDVIALDVSSGLLKWALSHCHAQGVSAVSFSAVDSLVYTSGGDKMICKIEPQTGELVKKFKGSNKAISSMAISPDGMTLAAASAQLKVFNCTDNQKIQKFSGHPSSARAIALSEDGKYIVSCAFGERYVVLWAIDGSKTRTSKCVFQMEHPAIFIECKVSDCFCILALSEIGVCYLWYGQTVDELKDSNPAKVSLSSQDSEALFRKGDPTILSVKLLYSKPSQARILVAYGSVVKPFFQKISIAPGEDKKLQISQQDALIPLKKNIKDIKIRGTKVTALDHSNVDDAIFTTAKVSHLGIVEPNESSSSEVEDIAMDEEIETDVMEQKLRQMKILESSSSNTFLLSNFLEAGDDRNASLKRIRVIVSSWEPPDALKALEELIPMWQSRTCNDRRLLLWIHCILVHHGSFISSQGKSVSKVLDSLLQMTKRRSKSTQMLLQLSGRLQLFSAQIDKSKEGIVIQDEEREEEDDDDDNMSEAQELEKEEESELSSDDNE